MLKFIKKFIKESQRREKISKANKTFYRNYGASRKVPVKSNGKQVGFITLARKNGFVPAPKYR